MGLEQVRATAQKKHEEKLEYCKDKDAPRQILNVHKRIGEVLDAEFDTLENDTHRKIVKDDAKLVQTLLRMSRVIVDEEYGSIPYSDRIVMEAAVLRSLTQVAE